MNISTTTDHVLTPPKGKEFASEFLTVPDVASLLKIRVDEVLLLIFANMLPSIWRDQAAIVKREDLHAFAMTVAMGLKDGEPFNTGLQRFIEWVRQSLIQPGLQDTSFDIMNAALNEVVNETELLVTGLISGQWSPDPDREDSTRELFQRANNANKDILAVDFKSAQQEERGPRPNAHRGKRSGSKKAPSPPKPERPRRPRKPSIPPMTPMKTPQASKSRDNSQGLSIVDEDDHRFASGMSIVDSLVDKSPSYKEECPAEPVKIEEVHDRWGPDDGPTLSAVVLDGIEGGEGVGIVAPAEEVEREIYFEKSDCSGEEIDDYEDDEEPECEEDIFYEGADDVEEGLYEEDDELCLEDSSESIVTSKVSDFGGGGGSSQNEMVFRHDELSLDFSQSDASEILGDIEECDIPAPDVMDSKMAPYEPSPIVSESPMPPADPFGGLTGGIGHSYGSDPFGDDAFGSASSGMSYQAPSMPMNMPAPPGMPPAPPPSQMPSGYLSPPIGAPMPPMGGRGGYSNAMPPPPPMPSPAMAPRMSQKKGGLGGLIGGALSAPFAVGAAAVGAAADLAERAVESRKSGVSRSRRQDVQAESRRFYGFKD
ncbi:MAG: hypothetical protein P1V97_09655 [Planctomycetota bacterium]|nr:hypothetical protein [Planctomycetota bacterium]